jgi:endonuclease III
MASRRSALADALDELEKVHGRPPTPIPKSPLDWILWENVAYLVDDERRELAYRTLERKVGLTAERLAKAPASALRRVAELGGMHPERRVEKLREIAELALEHGGGDLSSVLLLPLPAARRVLMAFPGIGDPGADRILVHGGALAKPALESNGLRVAVRLGYGEEKKSYSATYRSAIEALAPEIRADSAWLARAMELLRIHGKTLCKRTAPDCDACPLTRSCRYFAREAIPSPRRRG